MSALPLLIPLFIAFTLHPARAASVIPPETFGEAIRMHRTGDVREWAPETMYEHINGEAELLRRYGAVSLSNALYEGPGGTTLSVDIVDLGTPLNAFGLLALYSGCEGSPEEISGTHVFPGTYTSYARNGPFFIRIDVDSDDGASVTREFLTGLSGTFPVSQPLPDVVGVLQHAARAPCDVGYHPEDVDYDLGAGPGYLWTAPGGQACFMRLLETPAEAGGLAAALTEKGVRGLVTIGRAVAWSRDRTPGISQYLREVLGTVTEAHR
ncbi:MAG: hypothetical protein JSV26_01605 [bacterium]|nr:MAG: hypothetical protein JSV26_01605 [bacterium]